MTPRNQYDTEALRLAAPGPVDVLGGVGRSFLAAGQGECGNRCGRDQLDQLHRWRLRLF